MKIGTITFHGAYNYGSILQAYALQEFLITLGKENGEIIDYQIINYRPKCQKEIYWQIKPPMSIKNAIKWMMRLPYKKQLCKQAEGYETFMREKLRLTEEIEAAEFICFKDRFDFYLSGSDQVFNIRSLDFTFPNLLNFTESQKKISYAASLGPIQIDWSKYDKDLYVENLKKFKNLSVREQHSKEMIDELIGEDSCEIHIDPTLLLGIEQWRKVQSHRNYQDGQYIFIYCLEPTRKHMKIARELSRALGLPIISTGYRCKYDYFNPFVKFYDAGPADFLSLIDHAALILTSSFHGTAFSIIYDKPFWVIDGVLDNRIKNLLITTGLINNSISFETLPDFKTITPLRASAVNANKVLQIEKDRSASYILKALEMK